MLGFEMRWFENQAPGKTGILHSHRGLEMFLLHCACRHVADGSAPGDSSVGQKNLVLDALVQRTIEVQLNDRERAEYARIQRQVIALRKAEHARDHVSIIEVLRRPLSGCPEEAANQVDEHYAKFPFDTKLRVLVENLVDLRASDASGKCLVFSQFEKSLKALAALLAAQHFQTRIIGASVSVEKRQQALDLFQTDPPTTILLLTSRSGAVGLTLTAATHVFILEPNMNPAVEAQAIGRAYRMGQTSAVSVYRMVVKGTVEERIQKLLERRSQAQAPTAGLGPEQDTRDKDNVAGVTEAAMGASHIRSAGTRAFTPEEVAFLVGQRATLA
uniref:Helicase C-terminal domain-containing protein n=2 Tax=Mantoniella antarctica TaxID=81844 RepID=A0A7S0X4D7_9CHLO|mmetsp:Transcript_12604/g.30604  ORF Transcript_12604/g.30604 Transcript_12604/m.30604 type:complete len:330 (+) Transcript_12604:1188-2177(+)